MRRHIVRWQWLVTFIARETHENISAQKTVWPVLAVKKFQSRPQALARPYVQLPMSRISPVKRVIEARPVRGMRDRMGIDAIKHNHVCSIGQIIANLYGFQPVRAVPVQF
jgi:hypothetical protein